MKTKDWAYSAIGASVVFKPCGIANSEIDIKHLFGVFYSVMPSFVQTSDSF